MYAKTLRLCKFLSTKQASSAPPSKPEISKVFANEGIQKILHDITRFNEDVLFAKRHVRRLRSSKMTFMTDKQLEESRKLAYKSIKPKIEMPKVMEPNLKPPEIIAKDEEIIGYNQHKIMFIDIGHGYTNSDRLMSVREPNGILRYPTHEERSRLNHMFRPTDYSSIDPPRLFEPERLADLLRRKEYVFILNRACIQFEPDDPRFIEISNKVYDHINDCSDFKNLRSTRYFGPMSLYLIYNDKTDNLLIEMLAKHYIEDASKVVRIYHACNNITAPEKIDNDIDLINDYINNYSLKKHHVELALKAHLAKYPTID